MIFLVIAPCLGVEGWGADNALPIEVKQLVSRREQCHHWAGEEPYNKARAKQIDRAMTRLGCDGIDQEVDAMRKKYAGNPRVQAALPKDGSFE